MLTAKRAGARVDYPTAAQQRAVLEQRTMSKQLSKTSKTTKIANAKRPTALTVLKLCFAFIHKRIHAFFLICRGKQRMKHAALEHDAVG